jgi:hypothetical protein
MGYARTVTNAPEAIFCFDKVDHGIVNVYNPWMVNHINDTHNQ